MHFFNPPALMRLVEVVAAAATAAAAVETTAAVAERMGRTAIRCVDSPGFIVNRCNRPYALESLRILEEGLATHAADRRRDDRARRLPDGPVRAHGPDRDRRQPRGRPLVPPPAPARPVGAEPDLGADGRSREAGAEVGRGLLRPTRRELRRAGPVTGTNPNHPAPPDVVGALSVPPARAGYSADEILTRVVAALVNEACFALGEGVAESADDIDTAMKLGLNHPKGPFEWAPRARARRGPSDARRPRGRRRERSLRRRPPPPSAGPSAATSPRP